MNTKMIVRGGVVALVVAVVGVWFLFFRDDAPDAVSTDAGLEQLQADLDADGGTGGVTPVPADGPVNGTWTVDDDFGTFDFETASGSFAGFRVNEELTIGSTVAVGRSGGVTGALTIEDGVLTAAEISIDMGSIVSNDGRRESAIRRVVGANEFPDATFVLTEAVTLPDGLADGDTVSVEAVGDLSVKGTTNRVTFALEATIADAGVALIVGSTGIVWEDFGVTPPSAPIVVSIADEGIVEFQLVVRQNS